MAILLAIPPVGMVGRMDSPIGERGTGLLGKKIGSDLEDGVVEVRGASWWTKLMSSGDKVLRGDSDACRGSP